MKKLVMVIFLISGSAAYAEGLEITVNSQNLYQGQVLKIESSHRKQNRFRVRFNKREYQSYLFDNKQIILIGIDYQLKPSTYAITGSYKRTTNIYIPLSWKIKVIEKYPKQTYVPSKRKPEVQKRINEESAKKKEVFSAPSERKNKMDEFVRPIIPSYITGAFGNKRCTERKGNKFFNCQYHLGTDYRAAFDEKHFKAEAIKSIGDGKVILIDSYLMDGKIVVIDHGNGITSGYLHLSKTFVKAGVSVKTGQKIGMAGHTGATRAIHLHLFLKMDNGKTTVDPEYFLKSVIK